MNTRILTLMLLSLFLVGMTNSIIGNSLHISGGNEEKPDLIITDIFENNDFLANSHLYVKVLNDGDVAVNEFKIRTIIERLLFGSIVIRTIYDHKTYHGSSNPLSPGEEWNCTIYEDRLFLPGFFNIHTIVNPDKEIDEYNFSNNDRNEKFFGCGILFWRWYQSY